MRVRTALVRLLLGAALVAASGCESLGYYRQSVAGHLALMLKREPVADVVARPETAPALREALETASRARAFASAVLALPDNESYRSYVAVDRPYVVWSVVVAPELSLTPRRWCFPVAGCVSYRGYYARDGAEAFAAGWRRRGYDVAVSGVRAYSTLGWFADPLLSTMLAGPRTYLPGVIFHELAHQRVYVAGDTAFNEAFAVTVEQAGLERWLEAQGDASALAAYAHRRARHAEFVAAVLAARDALAGVYAGPAADAAKRGAKARVLARLRADVARLGGGGEAAGYAAWLGEDLNNAKLALVSTYHRQVPAFERLLARSGGDFEHFYARVAELAARPRAEREAALLALARDAPGMLAVHRGGP